jgi:hypothetical protein
MSVYIWWHGHDAIKSYKKHKDVNRFQYAEKHHLQNEKDCSYPFVNDITEINR